MRCWAPAEVATLTLNVPCYDFSLHVQLPANKRFSFSSVSVYINKMFLEVLQFFVTEGIVELYQFKVSGVINAPSHPD
jgi:hypothetical protein